MRQVNNVGPARNVGQVRNVGPARIVGQDRHVGQILNMGQGPQNPDQEPFGTYDLIICVYVFLDIPGNLGWVPGREMEQIGAKHGKYKKVHKWC